MSSVFHFPKLLWRDPHPDLRVSHPFWVGYDSCGGGVKQRRWRIYSISEGVGLLSPQDYGFPHLSRWCSYLLILTSCFS